MVESGATHTFVDPYLTPRLKEFTSDYRVLNVPQNIVGVGERVLKGVATGIVQATVTDFGGHRRQLYFDAFVVPGMGSNLVSVITTMQKGIATLSHPDKPRLEYDDVVLPMNVLETEEAAGRLLCSFYLELGGGSGGLALRAESADLCNRRMRHINRKLMDVLRKQEGNGVEYNGDIQVCDVCVVGKSEQQAHPKQVTCDGQRASQLRTVDTMGPISAHALGGYNYATNVVDQHTKRTEIFLIKERTGTVDYLELFHKGLVIPTGVRLDRLKAEKGTEFTNFAFKQYCRDTAIKLDFASTNTPKQLGANERAGRTFAGILSCMLANIGLPKFLWGELMLTAVYLSKSGSTCGVGQCDAVQDSLRQGCSPLTPSVDGGNGVRAR